VRDLERKLEVDAGVAVETLLRAAGLGDGDYLIMELQTGPSVREVMRVRANGQVSPACGGGWAWDSITLGSFLEQVDEALAEWNRQRVIRESEARTMQTLIDQIGDKARYLNDPKMVDDLPGDSPTEGRMIRLLLNPWRRG